MTLYAVRQNQETGAFGDEPDVVAQAQYGTQYIEDVIALWRLVESTKADRIDALLADSSYAPDIGLRYLSPTRACEFVGLLEGLEEALVTAQIVDSHWCVPAENLEELARLVPSMDLKTERSIEDKTFALGEVMTHVSVLRSFLTNAVDAGCSIVFD